MPKQRRQRGPVLRTSRTGSTGKDRGVVDLTPFDATVRDLSSDGRGVLSDGQGRTMFVPGVWPGERVRVQRTPSASKTPEARLLAVLEPHEARRRAPCAHHGTGKADCGGCPWQFMTYSAQVDAKQQRVVRSLQHLGMPDVPVQCLPAPDEFGYRNRAQLKTDGEQLGYVAARSHHLVDIKDCPVLEVGCSRQLEGLRARLPHREWCPSHKKEWTTIDIDSERADPLINQRQPFRQGNALQNETMRRWVAQALKTFSSEGSRVLELFAGSGNFTEVVASSGRPVCAAEVAEECLQGLADKDLPNVVVKRCDLFDREAAAALARQHRETEMLLLDPPRNGWLTREDMLPALKRLQSVFYISCDLATWQRDAAYLISRGFRVRSVSMIDLFPQTPHVEVLSVFSRHDGD